MVLARDRRHRCIRSQVVHILICWRVVQLGCSVLLGRPRQAGIAARLVVVDGTGNPIAQIRAQGRKMVLRGVEN